jgi:septal ring factor EnvC (AmiA/AmiB activator)
MVCSMIKKAVLGTALGAGLLYMTFGTSAPSYVRTAFHKVRHNAKDAIPDQFMIDKARQEVTDLEPAIRDNIEILARGEVEVEHLDGEIVVVRGNLENEKKAILALRERLESGDFRLAGHRHVNYTAEEVKADLTRKLDHYRNVNRILHEKEETLKARQKSVVAARKLLTEMAAQKQALLTKLEGIEAKLKMIEATRATNEFNFDDSALSRAKQSISELEKRLEVLDRKAEMEGRFTDSGIPVSLEPGRDVVKEIDEEFGAPASPSPSTAQGDNDTPRDKSL